MRRNLSPAQRHLIRVSAAIEAAKADPHGGMATGSAYELMSAKMTQDRARLKAIQSQEQKIVVKQSLLPDYADYVQAVVGSGVGAQDDVLTRIMVWRIDVGDVAGALEIARYVFEHNLATPDNFARSPACLLVEETAEIAMAALVTKSEPPSVDVLMEIGEMTKAHDMPDEVRAKLHKAIARIYDAKAQAAPDNDQLALYQLAFDNYVRALDLNEKCGVKQERDRTEKVIKKFAEASTPAAN